MGLLAKIKQALKPKENKKKKNVKTYTDNPLLKTKKKETSSTKKTTPNGIKGTLPTGKDRLDDVVKKKADIKKTTIKTTDKRTTTKTSTSKSNIKTYTDNPLLKTKGTGDTLAQYRTRQKAISELKKAEKAKRTGNTKLYDEHTEKARTYKNQYNSMKSTQEKGYESLSKNEMALLQTAMLTGNMDYASKVIRNAENGAYTRDDKVRNEYANMGKKIGGQHQYSVDTNAGLQGFLEGSGWVSIKHVQEQLAGSPIESTGDQTGMYNVGNMAGVFAQAGTAIPNIAGQSVKAAFKVGAKEGLKVLGKNGVRTAIAELPVNVTYGLKEATEKADAGKEIPSVLDDVNLSTEEAKGGVLYKEDREAGFSAEDAEDTTSINNWNNDLVVQAWDRAEKLGQQPIFGVDNNGMLHYSFSNEGLANILEYYNQSEDPTYALESTKMQYKGSFAKDFAKSVLINTAMSFGAGAVLSGIGKGGKEVVNNAENIAPKTAKEVTESVAPKVDVEPKTKPKTELKTKPKPEAPKVKTSADKTVVKNEVKTLPKAETKKAETNIKNKNTEYKIKQSEFTKNVNKAKEGDTVYKFKDGSEIKLESKVYNGKDGYDNFYTVMKNDGTKVENVLREDLANTLKTDSAMQTVKPKADLPKVKETKEVNNITDAINSKGFKNKLDNATEGTVLAKTKEGREIKYAGLDENGNDLFTVVRNGKTEAEEISLQELKKLKNLKLTSTTLPTKSVGADKARPAENMDDLIGKNIYRVDTDAGKKDLIAKDEEELVKLAENQGIELNGEPEVLHTINNLDDAKKYAVPDANEYGKVSDTASTMMNAKILEGAENPAMAREAVQKSIEDGSYYKDVIPNYTRNELGNIKQGVVNKANKRINDVGIDESMKDLESVVREGKRATSKDVALGYRVAEELGKAGRYDEMSEVLANVSSILSDAGRTLQAAKLFGVLTGDAKKIAITKQVNRIKNLHPDSDIKINKELLDNIVNAADDATAAKAQDEFFMDIWNQVPPSLVEKLDTFRHLAMLGNLKTHVRNMLGNAIFIIPRYVSDTLASGMEAMLIKSGVIAKRMAKFGNTDEIFRNKVGLFRMVDPEINKLAKDSFKGKADILLGNSSKYIEKSRPLDAPVFWKMKNGEKKSNPFGRLIDRLAKANGIALETEDKYFMGIAYDKAFKDFCSANKITKANMTEDLMSKAEEYATQQCLEATYRNQNEIANALSKARKNFATIKDTDTPAIKAGKTVGRLVMDSAIPYIKTPANIVAKGVEYSPAGIFMGLYKLRAARTPKEFMRGIEYFAEGLTGSGIAGLGVYLAHRGIINGQLTEEDNKYYKQDLGQQSYAVTIKGKSVTVDWMVPAALPLLTGVAMYENVYNSVVASGEEGLSKLNTIATAFIEGLSTLPEPIMELSMLQGVENVIKQSFVDDNPLRAIGFNTATNYISQFVPTAAGQIARTIEPNRHTTEVVDKTGLAKGVEKTGKKLLNKIPFGTKLTQEYVDCWGRPVENGSDNALVRFIYQAFSPAYVSPDRMTKVDEEIIRLNGSVGGQIEGTVIPNWNAYTESKITIDETNYQMTDEDYTRYKKTVGQAKYEGLKELFNDKDYKAASDTDKADMVKEVYQAAKDKGVLEYVSTLGKDVKRKYLISKLPESTRERVKLGKVKNVDKLIKANDTLKEMDLGSINTKSGGTRQISALIKNGYTKEDLKDLGYSTKIKYTKTGKIKETSYSKAVHINELGFDYEAIYKETRKKKAVQAYDQNDSKSLDTAEEVKAWLDAEHPNWSNDKKWTYLYGATGVSRYSRSKYGY